MYQNDYYQDSERRRQHQVGKFYGNLMSWIGVSLVLFFINFQTYDDSQTWWAFYPFLFWGLALFLRGVRLFGPQVVRQYWEERQQQQAYKRQIKQEYRQQRREQRYSKSYSREPWVDTPKDNLDLPQYGRKKTPEPVVKQQTPTQPTKKWDDRDLV